VPARSASHRTSVRFGRHAGWRDDRLAAAPRLAALVTIPWCLAPHPIWRIPQFGCDQQAVCYSLAFCEPRSSATCRQMVNQAHSHSFVRAGCCRNLRADRVCTPIHRRTGPRVLRDRQRVHRRTISFAACPNRVCAPGPCVPSAGAKAAIAWFTLFPMRLNCKSKETA
jgi:hypothetical protein